MSVKVIQERLETYKCLSLQDEERAFKEIAQEIALGGLSRGGFFKYACFQGGTALRILYSLERFSEDLDFVLKVPLNDFSWESYFKALAIEFEAYGIELDFKDRAKTDETIKKLFIKSDSMGKILNLKYPKMNGVLRTSVIKFEIDINPPAGSLFETRYLDFPFSFPITVQDLPSMFAGKSHALLCRDYIKGRDWFDFLWYVARKTNINFKFLSNAINQFGPWKKKEVKVTKIWYFEQMIKKIKSINWKEAKKDVERFLKPKDLVLLDLWNQDFFMNRLEKIKSYL